MCCLIDVFLTSAAIKPPNTYTHTQATPLPSPFFFFFTSPAELGIGEMPRKQNQVRRGVGAWWLVRGDSEGEGL